MKRFNFLDALIKSLVVVSLVFSSWMVSAAANDYVYEFPNEELKQRYEQLTFELRCPKCQNQNVADSNAPISADIREKVYQLLMEGKSNQEIIDYMVARYTEFVTYRTPINWATVWLYILPIMLLVAGIAVIVRRTRQTAPAVELTEEQKQQLNQLLNKK